MRILILEPYANIRGPLPKLIPLLSTALKEAGCEVMTTPWGRHHDLETGWEMAWGRMGDIYRIRSLMARDHYDVLFIQSAHDWKAIARDIPLLLATRGLYRRAILQIHGSSLDWLEDNQHQSFKTATRLLFRLCDAVIVSSHTEREAFARFVPNRRFFVADNIYQPEPIEPSLTVPAEWGLPSDRPIIFFAGRFIPEKGVLDLLTAIPLILEQTTCYFLLAGVGPLEAEVQARLAQPPLTGHVSWVRYLDRPHLELAYHLTTVFVLPTYHIEGFPAVIQDALGHGLPIITTPIRGVADHLVDGVHARLIPPQNPEVLARAVVELLQDPAFCQRMSAANREKVKDFSSAKVGQQYLQILQRISISL